MHEPVGGDTVNVGGQFYYKDTDPATEVVAADMNGITREIAHAVTASSQTLAADAAADAAAGYRQLADAIAETDPTFGSKSYSNGRLAVGTGTEVVNAGILYLRHALRKITTMMFPETVITPAAAQSVLVINSAGGASLPNYLLPAIGTWFDTVVVTFNSAATTEICTIQKNGSVFEIRRIGGGNFGAGLTHRVWAFSKTFINAGD